MLYTCEQCPAGNKFDFQRSVNTFEDYWGPSYLQRNDWHLKVVDGMNRLKLTSSAYFKRTFRFIVTLLYFYLSAFRKISHINICKKMCTSELLFESIRRNCRIMFKSLISWTRKYNLTLSIRVKTWEKRPKNNFEKFWEL